MHPNHTSLVLNIGGLSAQHLPTYGNNWLDTPNINRLANQSEVFEFAFTDRLIRPPEKRGILPPADVRSVLISDCIQRFEADDVSRFSSVVDLPKQPAAGLAGTLEETQIARSFASMLEVISDHLAGPTHLIWIELAGMHGDWDAPYSTRESFVEEEDPSPPYFHQPPVYDLRNMKDVDPDLFLGIQQAFAGQLYLLDICLGVLLDHIELETRTDLTFALTADQGYPLGEHGVVGTRDPILFGESIHIPWIIYQSRIPPTTIRHQKLCYSHEIAGEIHEFCRAEVQPAHGPNHSLDQMIGTELGRQAVLTTCLTADSIELRSLRTAAWLWKSGVDSDQLFVKPDDRWEVNNVASRRPDIIERMSEIADQISRSSSQPSIRALELDDELTTTWGR